MSDRRRILYVEPFETGSHAAFTETLTTGVDADWTVLTLPGRHWKWRMRGSAVYFALAERESLAGPYDLVFASSFLPLAELVALAESSLAGVPRILYFHENQLDYPPSPSAAENERDLHYGFTQLTSALAADRCVFNTRHNRDRFLARGKEVLGRMPDAVPAGWIEWIRASSAILPVPLDVPDIDERTTTDVEPGDLRARGPLILWNHRWEHDKAPEVFFDTLRQLAGRGVPFRVAVCGQRFEQCPTVFDDARTWLGERVAHWGYAEGREAYHEVLNRAQIVVSTARQEYQGLAVLEATHHGARPLVPDRLVYPEIYPSAYLYQEGSLVERLEELCRRWTSGLIDLRGDRSTITARFRASRILPEYRKLIDEMISEREAEPTT